MNKKLVVLILATVLITGVLFNQPVSKAATGDWTLVWSDEFTGPDSSAIDSTKWGFGSNDYSSSEAAAYTNRTTNCYIQNNMCVIKAMKEAYGGYSYTSARISTVGKFNFTYGKIEMSAKLPYGQGVWPSFWMLGSNYSSVGWPNCGEIDIMENIGSDPDTIHGSIFGPGYNSGGGLEALYNLSGGSQFKDGFHTFSVEWDPNVIRWYCDGNLYQTRTPADIGTNPWPFDKDFYLNVYFNLGGAWPGYPNSTTVFPQYYTIDYIRVYQREGGYQATPTPTPTPPILPISLKIEAESYNTMSGVQTETCSEGGQNVGWIDTGDWMDYIVNLSRGGYYKVDYRVSSPYTTGKVDLKVGGVTLASTAISNTGGWQAWRTVSVNSGVSLYSGQQTIRLAASSGGWNINWLSFYELVPTPNATQPQPSNVTPTPTPVYTLTVSSQTGGSVQVSPPGSTVTNSMFSYGDGTVVTLKAIPAAAPTDYQYVFIGWSGDLTGTQNSAIITMNKNQTVPRNLNWSGRWAPLLPRLPSPQLRGRLRPILRDRLYPKASRLPPVHFRPVMKSPKEMTEIIPIDGQRPAAFSRNGGW